MGNGRVYFAGPPYNADGRRTRVDDDASRGPDKDFDFTSFNRLRNRYQAFGSAAWVGRGDRTIGLYETGRRPATVSFLLGCAIVVPAIAIGVLASGCAAYPVAASCISTPWTPSAEALAYQTQLILSSARAGGNWLATAHSTSEIVQIWIVRDRSGAFVVISAFLAAGFGIVHYVLKGRFSNAPRHENLIWPMYIAVIGTIYVAVTAPTGRFMGGYAAVAVAIVVCCFFPSLVRAISPKVRYTFAARKVAVRPAVCVIGVVSLLYSAPHQNLRDMTVPFGDRVRGRWHQNPDTGSGFLVPHRVIPINLHRPESVPLTKWRRPSQRLPDVAGPEANTECWAAPPPCVPQFSGGKALIYNRKMERPAGLSFPIAANLRVFRCPNHFPIFREAERQKSARRVARLSSAGGHLQRQET